MTELLTPDLIAQLDTLELKARRIVDGLHLGQHRGKRIGFSSDFAEHREYSPGDDVRHIDWKIYAKRDRFYVRRFEDDVKLQAWMLVDFSGSMTYRSEQSALSKLEYVNCLAASLMWILAQQQDRVGLLTWTDSIEEIYPPRSDPAHVRQLYHHLETLQHKVSESSHRVASPWNILSPTLNQITPHSIVFVYTDAFGDSTEFLKVLKQLRYQHCDVRILHILDPAERSFPFTDNRRFHNLEGEDAFNVTAPAIRNAYLAEIEQWLEEIQTQIGDCGCDYKFIDTNTSFNQAITRIVRGT